MTRPASGLRVPIGTSQIAKPYPRGDVRLVVMSPDKYRALLEKLADLEHQQWMEWAKNLAAVEVLSASRIARWEKLMVPYDQLTENAKEQDRKWARRIIREIITPGAVEFAQASAKKLGELLAEL